MQAVVDPPIFPCGFDQKVKTSLEYSYSKVQCNFPSKGSELELRWHELNIEFGAGEGNRNDLSNMLILNGNHLEGALYQRLDHQKLSGLPL